MCCPAHPDVCVYACVRACLCVYVFLHVCVWALGLALGDLKIALRGGGGGGDMDARRRRGGGVGEKGFRVGPFVLCKNACWRRRRRNTKFGPKKFFPPIISPPTFE